MSHAAFTQRESGILTPTATLDREHYTMPEDDFKKLHRLMKFAGEYELMVRYHCVRCKAPIRLRRLNQIVVDLDNQGGPAPGGDVRLFCDCAEWIVKRHKGAPGIR